MDDTIPRSTLYLLEQDLSLPLGCAEPNDMDISMPPQIRMQYHFFLADTSLRIILSRITTSLSTRPENNKYYHHQGHHYHHHRSNPYHVGKLAPQPFFFSELKQQLEDWEAHVPTLLEWSSEPGRGTISSVGTRIKLTYWFSGLQLARLAIQMALHDTNARLSLQEWSLVQQGVVAGINLVKTFIFERANVDVIAGNRYVLYSLPTRRFWVHAC
jgi:hypothetical protein